LREEIAEAAACTAAHSCNHARDAIKTAHKLDAATALRDALAKIEQQAVKQRKRAATIARRPKAEVMTQVPEAAAS